MFVCCGYTFHFAPIHFHCKYLTITQIFAFIRLKISFCAIDIAYLAQNLEYSFKKSFQQTAYSTQCLCVHVIPKSYVCDSWDNRRPSTISSHGVKVGMWGVKEGFLTVTCSHTSYHIRKRVEKSLLRIKPTSHIPDHNCKCQNIASDRRYLFFVTELCLTYTEESQTDGLHSVTP